MSQHTVQSRRQKAKVTPTRCDHRGCAYPAVALSSYCGRHLRGKKLRGHPTIDKALRERDLRPVWLLTTRYLAAHPPPPEVIQALDLKVLSPLASLDIGRAKEEWRTPSTLATARKKLRLALDWWRDKASEKKWMHGAKPRRTDPVSVLAVLLATFLYTDERQWPGDSPKYALALMLLKMRTLRHSTQPNYKKGVGTVTRTTSIPANVRRLLGQVIVDSTIGVWLILTAKAITDERQAQNAEATKRKLSAPRPVAPIPYKVVKPKPTDPIPITQARKTAPDVVLYERPKVALPPRYPKPNFLGRTTADITEWMRVEGLWQLHPSGYY